MREVYFFSLSWLFLGSILAGAGTVRTEPHCGGEEREDISSKPLYTWPMGTINKLIHTRPRANTKTDLRKNVHVSERLFLCKC